MDCPGGPAAAQHQDYRVEASTLVLMDCPGGQPVPDAVGRPVLLQPLF